MNRLRLLPPFRTRTQDRFFEANHSFDAFVHWLRCGCQSIEKHHLAENDYIYFFQFLKKNTSCNKKTLQNKISQNLPNSKLYARKNYDDYRFAFSHISCHVYLTSHVHLSSHLFHSSPASLPLSSCLSLSSHVYLSSHLSSHLFHSSLFSFSLSLALVNSPFPLFPSQ